MNALITKGKRAAFPLMLLSTLLFSNTLQAQTAPDVLRKPVGKGAYEMAYSPSENALYLATSQSRKLDKGGIVYRLDPTTLDVTQIIHNDIKPFGAAINAKSGTLFFGNTVNNSVTAIDAKTGDVKGRLVLDARQRSKPSSRWRRASWWRMPTATRCTSPGWGIPAWCGWWTARI